MKYCRVALAALGLLTFAPSSGAYHLLEVRTPDGDIVELSWSSSFPVGYYIKIMVIEARTRPHYAGITVDS